MLEFKRNKKSGALEVWENGKLIGNIRTTADDVAVKGNTKPSTKT